MKYINIRSNIQSIKVNLNLVKGKIRFNDLIDESNLLICYWQY